MGKEDQYIDKKIYEATEKTLCEYYTDEKVKKSLMTGIKALEKSIDKLTEDIKKNNVILSEDDYFQSGVGISEKVQTSSAGTSLAERLIMNAIDKMEEERANKIERIRDLKSRISEMEERHAVIKDNIEQLQNEYQNIIKYKYKEDKGFEWIATELNYSSMTVRRKLEDIILDISRNFYWLK